LNQQPHSKLSIYKNRYKEGQPPLENISTFRNELPRAKAFRFGSNSLREERYLIALSSKTLRRKRLGIKPVQIKTQFEIFRYQFPPSRKTSALLPTDLNF